jgi:hypothetical protein
MESTPVNNCNTGWELRFRVLFILLAIFCFAAPAHARQRVYAADPGCNIIFPCEGVTSSARGERVVKAMGGFGSARKQYTPATIVPHPAGCPRRAFCGCGAAVRVFGSPVRSLWLAAAWYRFPRSWPAPGAVAVRSHHVMVLEADLGNGLWQVFDANSGGHATRIHARSIAGYTIVSPR